MTAAVEARQCARMAEPPEGIASDLASEGWARLAGGDWAAASCAPARRVAALDRDFLEFATRASSGPPQGPAEYRYEYLLVVVRRRAL